MKRTRLSLDVDADTKTKLEAIQTRMNTTSMTDVIRRAIALLDVVTQDPAGKITITTHGQPETAEAHRARSI